MRRARSGAAASAVVERNEQLLKFDFRPAPVEDLPELPELPLRRPPQTIKDAIIRWLDEQL